MRSLDLTQLLSYLDLIRIALSWTVKIYLTVILILVSVLLASCSKVSLNDHSDLADIVQVKLPNKHFVESDSLILYSDSPFSDKENLVEELLQEKEFISKQLHLQMSDERIRVYLFESSTDLDQYMRQNFPELFGRAGYFIQTNDRLFVYAVKPSAWEDNKHKIDLRHEVAHAYIHGVIPDIPLAIDEGLAEFFELPRENIATDKINSQHVKLLIEELEAGRWQPNLSQLEGMNSWSDMDLLDYAEAWLWVHFLLTTTEDRRKILLDHLKLLSEGSQGSRLNSHLQMSQPDPNGYLLVHLHTLNEKLIKNPVSDD